MGLVRRAQWDQHGCPSKREKRASLEGSCVPVLDARSRDHTRRLAHPVFPSLAHACCRSSFVVRELRFTRDGSSLCYTPSVLSLITAA